MIIKKFIAAAAACTLIGNFLPTLSLGNTQYVMTANAYTRGETDEFTYVNMGANIKISMAKSPSGVLNIPSDIGGFPVTDIMMQAFQDQPAITAVNLPDTLTSIDFMAFANCTGLTSVTLPKSLKYLEDGAFMNCFGITTVTIYSRDCQIAGESSIPEEAVIYGYSGSTAETYARSYGRSFIALPDGDDQTTTATTTTTTTTTTTSTTMIRYKPRGGFKVKNMPYKTVYNIGEQLDLNGLTIDFIYYDEYNQDHVIFSNIAPMSRPDCFVIDTSDFDPYTTGVYDITLSCTESFAQEYSNNLIPFHIPIRVVEQQTPETTTTTTTTSTTTTTTTTSEPPATTTVTTNVVPPVSRRVGDTSGDGEISPLDASMALVAYAVLSTGGTYEMCGITDENFYIYDVDNNGEISPMDSSLILSFYAYLSTGGIIEDMSVWMNQK